MKYIIYTSFAAITVICLVSCGSVTAVKPNSTVPGSVTTVGKTYSKVLVQDFTPSADSGAEAATGAQFAAIIAGKVMSSKPTVSVSRTGKADANTLIIGGEITRFVEGNAALRLLIGMGAGSSYFDANVRLSDGVSGAAISSLKADKNSWGLGGSIAASQTVETFMNEAATKTAQTAVPYLK